MAHRLILIFGFYSWVELIAASFGLKINTERTDNGINKNPMAKKGIQLPPLVSTGTKYVDIIMPSTAAAPPSPANDPTVFPEWKSLGRVWILVMAN